MAIYDRLSAQDRSFLDLETGHCHMHVAGAFVFEGGPLRRPDGGIDIDRIREYVASRLHQIPRYRQRIARIPLEDHPVWVDDDSFNIHYHVRHTALPTPGDDRQLKRLCARIMSQKLERSKPLWEMWIVEGLEEDRIAMVSKTHHCMIDGVSGMDLLQVVLRMTPDKTFEAPPVWIPNPAPSDAQLLVDAALRRASLPLQLARSVRRALADPRAAVESLGDALEGLGQAVASTLQPASDSPLNRPLGAYRRFDWLAFDLDEVKRVKDALGGTVNDVVLASVAGGVGRFLRQRGFAPAKLRGLDFRAFCPVSVRSREERGALGNRVSGLIVPLPVGEEDAAERLQRVTLTTGDLKASKQALGAEVLSSVGEWTAPTLVSVAARLSFGSRSSNLVVTNVPGPQLPLYLLGARMLESYPMVPLFDGHGLGIALFSYAGGLYWGFNADWDLFPDLHDLVEAVDRAFRELGDAADAAEPES